MIRLILSIFVITIVVLNSVQAEWASYEDASLKISYRYEEININGDGTYEIILEEHMEILKEPGRDRVASYNLEYNEDSQKIKILSAKTIYDCKEYKVNDALIEDKPLASNPKEMGFDQKRQIVIAFPKAEVGAVACLKYRLVVAKVPLENFFSMVFYFDSEEFVNNSQLKISSQLPLHILVNDPEGILNITKDKEDKFYKLEINLIMPSYKHIINEPKGGFINPKHLTWVSVSSLNEWKDLAVANGKNYVEIFSQDLPEDFVRIAEIAAEKKDEVEQINAVTSLLIKKIQYMGDWRSINGRFKPRNLAEISGTQLGDCKDFSAVTAAILIRLGYKAQIANVRRGVGNPYPDTLPHLGIFNHAVVKATGKYGREYWIDPTNGVSMADGIFPDIAGKMALVADLERPGYEKIPTIDPNHAQRIWQRQIEILDGNSIIESGNVTFKNEAAIATDMIGAALKLSERDIKNRLYYTLSGVSLKEENKKKMELPDLSSRIARDISFNYCFEQNGSLLKTNMGSAIALPYDFLDVFFDISQNSVGDILVSDDGAIGTIKKRTVIKGVYVKNVLSFNKEVDTPWLYIKREAGFNHNKEVQIDDTIIIRKNLITSDDFKKREFAKLKEDLEENFHNVAILFNKGSVETEL